MRADHTEWQLLLALKGPGPPRGEGGNTWGEVLYPHRLKQDSLHCTSCSSYPTQTLIDFLHASAFYYQLWMIILTLESLYIAHSGADVALNNNTTTTTTGSLPASVAMLAIFQLIEVPSSDLQLPCSLLASVVMLACDLQLAGNLLALVVMLASDPQLAGNLPAAVVILSIF